MNRAQYPDSNMILPGQLIELPCNMQYVAKDDGGKDHIWQATLYFANILAVPYLQGKLVRRDFTPIVPPTSQQDERYEISCGCGQLSLFLHSHIFSFLSVAHDQEGLYLKAKAVKQN
jgi:hypothetical protein